MKRELYEGGETHENFTQALWKAIAITQSVEWVKIGQIAPVSEAWKAWVDTAGEVVWKHKVGPEAEGFRGEGSDDEKRGRLPFWDAEQALTDFLNPDEAMRSV